MNKLNCWEFKKCGRHPGGIFVSDLGICPATQETRLNNVHGGINAGRICWIVTGTLCNGEIQGSFAKKYGNCDICDFYQTVKKEEFPSFQPSVALMAKISR